MNAEQVEVDLYTGMYRTMVLIRQFEQRVNDLFLRGEVYGSTHLCMGQEAVSAGAISALAPEDYVAATYRGHGHVLALGCDPGAYMAELLGRSTGTCAGRSGSMNVVVPEKRLIGCFGIIGGSLAAATGAGLTVRRKGGVAVGFFGDGTANQAYFHECLNFAKVLELPVVYVCENNQYGEYTPTEDSTPGGILARPNAMGITTEWVDGQDMWAVKDVVGKALAKARDGHGPVFIEANTYRYSDHGRGDPIEYRPEGEMERWKERDPLLIARKRLNEEYGVSEDALSDIDRSVDQEIEEITEFARESPFPDADEPVFEFSDTRVADRSLR